MPDGQVYLLSMGGTFGGHNQRMIHLVQESPSPLGEERDRLDVRGPGGRSGPNEVLRLPAGRVKN